MMCVCVKLTKEEDLAEVDKHEILISSKCARRLEGLQITYAAMTL